MKKITQNQLQLLILLSLVIILASAYRFGYQNFTSQTDTIQKENNQLKLRVAQLEQKMTQKGDYEEGIAEADRQSGEIFSRYGTGNTPEKSIMLMHNMEENAQMTISNIAFAPEAGSYFSTRLNEDGTSDIVLYSTQLSVNYETSYEGLKKCMDFINKYPERMNVENFNAVYNQETGLLTGAIIMNLYSIDKDGTTYKEPVVSSIPIGKDNIFGSR